MLQSHLLHYMVNLLMTYVYDAVLQYATFFALLYHKMKNLTMPLWESVYISLTVSYPTTHRK